jgi:uncharacterized protein YecA (UPF0149 family)
MGAMAEALVAYAQPLLDETDGSMEQIERAFALSQMCFNLAQLPEERRNQAIGELKEAFEMDDEEFEDFRFTIVIPMINRHHEMFPGMAGSSSTGSLPSGPSFLKGPEVTARREPYPGTPRYAPCPCDSGRKYKFCCGNKKANKDKLS